MTQILNDDLTGEQEELQVAQDEYYNETQHCYNSSRCYEIKVYMKIMAEELTKAKCWKREEMRKHWELARWEHDNGI